MTEESSNNNDDSNNNDRLIETGDIPIPILSSKEVSVRETPLGQGGFCTVSAIYKFNLNYNDDNDANNTAISSTPTQILRRQAFTKQFDSYQQKYYDPKNIRLPGQGPIVEHPSIQKPPRVALKRVKASLKNNYREKWQNGVNDLMNEIKILSKCSHPNIITLYAVGYDDDNDDYDNNNNENNDTHKMNKKCNILYNFAIIDQLKSTLRNKIYKWNEDKTMNFLPFAKMKKANNESWLERLVIMVKVADALQYLHSRGIIHRDIHPENIGFSYDNDMVKLFDFGLATCCTKKTIGDKMTTDIVHNSINADNDNELFDLTNETGTIRYMAPEVAMGLPYGFKVDVYSLGLVLHETLSLRKPFLGIKDPQLFRNEVMMGGLRPTLYDYWPKRICNLVDRMWANDVASRPSSKEVVNILSDLLREGDDVDLYPIGKFDGWKSNFTYQFW